MKKDKVIQQGLHCLVCEDEIFSEYTHDFKECTCGNCFVDGGKSYFRYGFYDIDFIEVITRD